MNDSMYKIFIELENKIKSVLNDKYINDYTKWQYKRFEMLMEFLHNEYDI